RPTTRHTRAASASAARTATTSVPSIRRTSQRETLLCQVRCDVSLTDFGASGAPSTARLRYLRRLSGAGTEPLPFVSGPSYALGSYFPRKESLMARTERLDFKAIKNAADFSTILARTGVEMTRDGGELLGRCPFHDDTKPSFRVNLKKNAFYCFGCHAGG